MFSLLHNFNSYVSGLSVSCISTSSCFSSQFKCIFYTQMLIAIDIMLHIFNISFLAVCVCSSNNRLGKISFPSIFLLCFFYIMLQMQFISILFLMNGLNLVVLYVKYSLRPPFISFPSQNFISNFLNCLLYSYLCIINIIDLRFCWKILVKRLLVQHLILSSCSRCNPPRWIRVCYASVSSISIIYCNVSEKLTL